MFRFTYIMRRAQEIRIEIVDDVNFEKDESFRVVLEKPTGGVQLAEAEPSAAGQPLACEVTIISDDATASAVERIAAICHLPINTDELGLATASWGEALRNALKPAGFLSPPNTSRPIQFSLPTKASPIYREPSLSLDQSHLPNPSADNGPCLNPPSTLQL
ncbi:MAG: hypothetical protein SGPRY_001743 [Prymnesium sp.]